MLKTLDILIGVSLVMLLVSMIVTVIVQFVHHVLNSRGHHLLAGIADLLEQVHPGIAREAAEEISAAVLTHPLVRSVNGRLGSIVHREELTKLLLEFEAGEGPQQLSADAARELHQALVRNNVIADGNPEAARTQLRNMLDNVRSLALQLELAHPELTNAARMRVAMLEQANSQFLAKINLWFDQTMDRVSERFTARTRYITFFTGLAVALVLQLDTAALVSRLSTDQALRESLVARAIQVEQNTHPGEQANNPDSRMSLDATDRQAIRDLMLNNILGIPQNARDWAGRWSVNNFPMKLTGIALTAMLLSLGAPFWYNALQNLIRLRSVIASKDDQQRNERQSPAAVTTMAVATAGAEGAIITTDERGDLAVTG
jgi:hypothetical protein